MTNKKKDCKGVHRWSVGTDREPSFCMCDSECTCGQYVVAECTRCGETMSSSEIEDILNSYKDPQNE